MESHVPYCARMLMTYRKCTRMWQHSQDSHTENRICCCGLRNPHLRLVMPLIWLAACCVRVCVRERLQNKPAPPGSAPRISIAPLRRLEWWAKIDYNRDVSLFTNFRWWRADVLIYFTIDWKQWGHLVSATSYYIYQSWKSPSTQIICDPTPRFSGSFCAVICHY